jgi:hypothetical protein
MRASYIIVVSALVVGVMLGVIWAPLAPESLKSINDNYGSLLGSLFAFFMVIVTTTYAFFTHKGVRSAQESFKRSATPVLIPNVKSAHGTECFTEYGRRQLGVNWRIKNIGNDPAIKIYARMRIQYVEDVRAFVNERYEYTYLAQLAAGGEEIIRVHFETRNVNKLIHELTIREAKNVARVARGGREPALKRPSITLDILYSNIHGQQFLTSYSIETCGIIVPDRDKEDRSRFWFAWNIKLNEYPLREDERFELSFISEIWAAFDIIPVERRVAQAFLAAFEAEFNR